MTTAFRKPHVGSWYKNVLVDVLARHAKDTDLCSMLNMVNGCVSREVKNKGKKQTVEYKSSFTKKRILLLSWFNEEPNGAHRLLYLIAISNLRSFTSFRFLAIHN
ncbi:unnamed protein product [Rotaria socialis]|uniref:Caspase family p10 domain-containing protein n=1 Tax=Rotaria socialis TaxID=392032 RepID=A0A821TJH5_9BILA|nr:unnamed protein product [Rotaria socialis]